MASDTVKRILNNKRRLALIIAVLVATAVLLSIGLRRQRAADSEYFTAALERGPLRNVVSATGTVQAVVTVQVGSQVSGQIQALYADYNSVVKRGQLLAKLDPRNFEAQVENASANLAATEAKVHTVEADLNTQLSNLQSAKANLEAARVTRDNTAVIFRRYSELSKQGILSQNDYDNAKANAEGAAAKYSQAAAAVEQVQAQINATKSQLAQAKAQVEQARADLSRAKINLEYTSIYSPIDGVVVSRNIDVGQTVAASLQAPTLFVIANDLTKMQVNANIDEADIGKISSKVGVKFTVDAYPNDTFTGRISEIRLNPQTVQNVVTYNVIVSVDNPELKLKPGMTANITITVAQRDNVLKVPNAALRYVPSGMTREKVVKKLAKLGQKEGGEPPTESDQAASGEGLSESSNLPDQAESSSSPEANRPATTAQPFAHGRNGARSTAKGVPSNRPLLAPGQMWNPTEKIKFPTTTAQRTRPAVVWVLEENRKPQPRRVKLGITDGVNTEIVSGDVSEGDRVVVGDAVEAQNQSGGQSPFGRPFGIRMPKLGKKR